MFSDAFFGELMLPSKSVTNHYRVARDAILSEAMALRRYSNLYIIIIIIIGIAPYWLLYSEALVTLGFPVNDSMYSAISSL